MPSGSQPDPSAFALACVARLRRLIRAAEVPFQDVAAHIGTSPSQMSKLLSGGRAMSLDQFFDACECIGADALAILDEAWNATHPSLSADAPSVTDAMDIADEIHGIDEGKKETYGLAARRGRRKADQQPHAE